MKVLAVVLAMATIGAGDAVGQCFRGRCNVSVPIGSAISVQNVVQPVISQRVRTGLFGRTIIGPPRIKNQVVSQVVQQQVAVPQVVQTVQAAPVVASFAPLALSSFSSASYGYGYGYQGGIDLPGAIRAEAGENVALLSAMTEYLQSLHLQVTGDGN